MKFKSPVFAATGRIVTSNGPYCVELVRPVALNLFKFCSEGPEFALHYGNNMCLGWGCSRIGCWGKYLGLRRRNSTRLEKTAKWDTTWYVFLTRYCWGVRGRRMRRGGHGHTWVISAYRILMGKREGKRPLERPWRRWEDSIGMDHKEIGLQGVDWIRQPEDRDLWRR